jgi:hypothetical protein
VNLYINLIAWGCLVVVVVALFLYHRWLENHEDHYIHLHNDSHAATIVDSQAAICKRIELVDKVKNALLVAAILYGLAIAGIAVYLAWTNPGS